MTDEQLSDSETIDLLIDGAEEHLNRAEQRSSDLRNDPLLKHMFEPPPERKDDEHTP